MQQLMAQISHKDTSRELQGLQTIQQKRPCREEIAYIEDRSVRKVKKTN